MAELPRYWRLGPRLLNLKGINCNACNTVYIRPHTSCLKNPNNNKVDPNEIKNVAIEVTQPISESSEVLVPSTSSK